MPEEGASRRAAAEIRLNTQVDAARASGAATIFIPGNHDWAHMRSEGWDQVRREAGYLVERGGQNVRFLPEDGCPGPVTVDVGRGVRLVLFDTQWWLHKFAKPVDPTSTCPADSEGEVLGAVRDALRGAAGRRVFVRAITPWRAVGHTEATSPWSITCSRCASSGSGCGCLPVHSQLAPSAPPPRPQETIAAFCRSEAIPFLDALPALRRSAQPAFIDTDHLSAAGMRAVAEQVLASGMLDGLLQAAPAKGVGATSVAALMRALEADAPAVRAAAASALERVGEAARPARPALVARLRDPDENARLRAADALLSIDPSPALLPQLRRMLEQDAAPVRATAARVVAAMGPAARNAVESLVAALEQPGEDVKAAVARPAGASPGEATQRPQRRRPCGSSAGPPQPPTL